MRSVILVRSGLAFLAATQTVVGLWALFLPGSFFAIPWVSMHMQYNEHLMQDYGAMNLAMSVVLIAASVDPRSHLIRPALVAYLVFAVSHFFIHFRFLHHLAAKDGAMLMLALGAAIAIPSALLALTGRLSRPSRC